MKRLNKEKRDLALRLLAESLPDARCALDHDSPFQLLVAVVLSAQTTDKKVNSISGRLFGRYPTAAELSQADPADVEDIIRVIGMYRQKSRNIIGLSRVLMEKYGGAVPDDQALLEELPGVGRKTANVVMSVAFGHQRIAVDTHVFRVSNRIGLVDADNVLDTENQLMKVIPEDQWTNNHHRLIWHGRLVCTARSPKCGECALAQVCMKRMR